MEGHAAWRLSARGNDPGYDKPTAFALSPVPLSFSVNLLLSRSLEASGDPEDAEEHPDGLERSDDAAAVAEVLLLCHLFRLVHRPLPRPGGHVARLPRLSRLHPLKVVLLRRRPEGLPVLLVLRVGVAMVMVVERIVSTGMSPAWAVGPRMLPRVVGPGPSCRGGLYVLVGVVPSCSRTSRGMVLVLVRGPRGGHARIVRPPRVGMAEYGVGLRYRLKLCFVAGLDVGMVLFGLQGEVGGSGGMATWKGKMMRQSSGWW